MTSAERAALEALAAEWLAKDREPSVKQTYETCAEQLLAKLAVPGTGDRVLVVHGPHAGKRATILRVVDGNCALKIDRDPKPQERHYSLAEVQLLAKLPKQKKARANGKAP